jgi:ATP-dependent Lon protease
VAERTADPGVAVGLAWTPSGGDILFIEATRMQGKGELRLTGQLGEVMKESALAAMSYLRAHSEELGIADGSFKDVDVHVHVPAGATPKDGPSAGVTMLVALASLFTGRPVASDLGMTGELTLRGNVLPVGGIKNKVLAARRAGLRRIVLPAKNEKDLEEIPEAAREGLEFVPVERVADVLEVALTAPRPAPRKGAEGKSATRKKPVARRRATS